MPATGKPLYEIVREGTEPPVLVDNLIERSASSRHFAMQSSAQVAVEVKLTNRGVHIELAAQSERAPYQKRIVTSQAKRNLGCQRAPSRDTCCTDKKHD